MERGVFERRARSAVLATCVLALLVSAWNPAVAAGAGGPPRPTANPYILATAPSDGDIQVPLTMPINVWFSSPANPTNISWNVTPAITLTPSWDPFYTNLTLTHTFPFWSCQLYSVTITGVDPGPMPNPWTFMTSCPYPFIVSTAPADGATNVSLAADVVVVFSKPMYIANLTWTITGGINLTSSWDPTATILTLSHIAPFADCVAYTVQISGSDTSGFLLVGGPVPNPWTFATTCVSPYIVSTLPASGEAGLALSTPIVVRFSESMDVASVAWTFTPAMPFTVSWDSPADTILTLTHTSLFSSCTMYTIGITSGKDLSGSPLVPGPVPNPWSFSTSCPGAQITNTTPYNLQTGVSVTQPIIVTFSRAMTPGNETLTIVPDPGGISRSWNSPTNTILTVTHNAFAANRTYTVTVMAPTLQPGPVPNPWSFTTGAGLTGTLVSPAAGADWTGGSSQTIAWTMSDAFPLNVDVWINYTTASVSSVVAGRRAYTASPATYTWSPLPVIDATDVVVTIDIVNSAGRKVTLSSAAFTIDSTPPSVTRTSPASGETNVPLNPPIVVQFSEPMDRTSVEGAVTLTPNPGGGTWAFAWNATHDGITITGIDPLAPSTAYQVCVGTAAKDTSSPGNHMVPGKCWSFTTFTNTPPSAAFSAPTGTERWSGGSPHAITWTLSDDRTPVARLIEYLNVSYAGSGGPRPVSGRMVGNTSHTWTPTSIDATDVRLHLTVIDGDGASATIDSPTFTIDSTPPALLVSFPGDGATGHKTTRDIWFVWTERVDRASFQAAFSLTPAVDGLVFTWSVSNLGGDVLLVSHDPLQSRTSYTATFSVSAKDDSDPGNFLPAPVVVRFSTQPPPSGSRPVALAVGQRQVEVGVPVTFDGTGSTGAIVSYAWRIADNQGGFVAVLVGPKPTYTFQQQGRYSVTLTVTDVGGASDDDALEIAVTSNPHSAATILFASGLLAAAALVAATEVGRYAALTLLLLPVVARRKKDGPDEQETRGMIRGYITGNPGDSYSDIKRHLGLTNGTLLYHLHILEKDGLVRSQVRGSKRLFYPREVRLPEDGGGLHEVQLRMLRAIEAIPGLAVTDVAGALGITSQLALYHLRDLAVKGRIRFERRGLRLRCYPDGPAAERPAVEG